MKETGARSADEFDASRALQKDVSTEVPGNFIADRIPVPPLGPVAENGVTFGVTTAEATITQYGRLAGDFVTLGAAVSGKAQLRFRDGSRHTVSARTGLVSFMGSVPMTARTDNFSHVHMTLPMEIVQERIDTDHRLLTNGFAQFPARGIARFLVAQFTGIAREGAFLQVEEIGPLMQSLETLALATLAQSYPDQQAWDAEHSHRVIYTASIQFIQLNLDEPQLGAGLVSAAVGCSRSSLYRAFQLHKDTVGTCIRRERLALAKSYLASDLHMPLKVISHNCGYRTADSFVRFFRNAAGQSPTEYRKGQAASAR